MKTPILSAASLFVDGKTTRPSGLYYPFQIVRTSEGYHARIVGKNGKEMFRGGVSKRRGSVVDTFKSLLVIISGISGYALADLIRDIDERGGGVRYE